ncbi:hypothetical protein ACDH60_27890, partial [Pseudomonas ficuserectae]|uniref:hypothetical protein n=1 Tax=Pseudomonas ficuserectae TaxID=53410 RepID=UPI003531C8CD
MQIQAVDISLEIASGMPLFRDANHTKPVSRIYPTALSAQESRSFTDNKNDTIIQQGAENV